MYCLGTYLFILYQYFQIHCNDVLVNFIGLFCFLTDHVGPPIKRSQCLIPNSYDWRFNAHQRQSISYNKINHKQCNFFINNSYSIGISTSFGMNLEQQSDVLFVLIYRKKAFHTKVWP